MSSSPTLSSTRLRLRRWREEDRVAFAAMNADARVMEFFASTLSRDERAIEVPGVAPFIGFAGLSVARFAAAFTPCVEIGWRLAFTHWRQGYATEAARLALAHGFGPLALPEILSFTSATNLRSRAVMERLGMGRDPAGDFDHPSLPEGHALRPHVLYRLSSPSYRQYR